MPANVVFEYAIIRLVPRVERGECINIGVVVFSRSRRFLGMRVQLDPQRIHAFAPFVDLEAVEQQLADMQKVCAGGRDSGPIGALPLPERFRWLIAPRSTIIQASPVHVGLCEEPDATLERLYKSLVCLPE